MSNKRISQLTDGTSFQAGDEAVVNRSGTNYKVDPTVGVVQQTDIGTDPNQVPLNQYLGSMAYRDFSESARELTVASLPSAGITGRYAYVTDGDSGLAWGATVVNTGSGATPYLVWDNGTNWTVVGK